MSKVAIDLKSFSHVKTSKGQTTLKHSDGHELILRHDKLPENYRKQLEALGGQAKDAATSSQKEEAQAEKPKVMMADGGMPTAENPLIIPRDVTSDQAPVTAGAWMSAQQAPQAAQPQMAPANIWGDAINSLPTEGNTVLPLPGNVSSLMPGNSGIADKFKPQAPMAAPAPDQGLAGPAVGPQGQAPGAQAPNPMAAGLGSILGGEKEALAGIYGQGKAAAQLGEEQAKINDAYHNQAAESVNVFNQKVSELDKEHAALLQDYQNSYIDPNKYWTGDKDGNGGHSRIMSAIGMILGGFNPTNQPNAGIEMLKYQMDKNLEAQAKNLNAKGNLLAHNIQRYGNLRDGLAATRMAQNDMVAHDLMSAAAKAQGGPNGMAMGAAKEAAGKLRMANAQIKMQLGMSQAMMQMTGSANAIKDPAERDARAKSMLDMLAVRSPEQYKTWSERYVPGYGFGAQPVPAKVRDEIAAHNKLEMAAKDLEQFTKTHNTFVPGTAAYNTGVQKSLMLQTLVREGQLGTVYREGEQPLLDKMVKSNPANLLKNFNTLPQLKELMRSNTAQLRSLETSYGLPSPAGAQHQGASSEGSAAGKIRFTPAKK